MVRLFDLSLNVIVVQCGENFRGWFLHCSSKFHLGHISSFVYVYFGVPR